MSYSNKKLDTLHESSSWDTYWKWYNRLNPDANPWEPGRRNLYRGILKLFGKRDDWAFLDASCGVGESTVLLASAGIDVDACDTSSVAIEQAKQRLTCAGFAGKVFEAKWETLSEVAPRRYDVILNDALSWIDGVEAFQKSLVGFRRILKPGGVLVFIGATNRHPEPGTGKQLLREAWERFEPERFKLVESRFESGLSVSHIVTRELGSDFIDEHHLYLITERCAPRLEFTTIRKPYTWDWPTLVESFKEAGFTKIDCVVVEIEGQNVILNFARTSNESLRN
jgi:SAM-dependent methyltransferase